MHFSRVQTHPWLHQPLTELGPHGIHYSCALRYSEGFLGFSLIDMFRFQILCFIFSILRPFFVSLYSLSAQGDFYHMASGRHLTPVEKLLFQSFPLQKLDLSCLTDRAPWSLTILLFLILCLEFFCFPGESHTTPYPH